MNSKRIYFFVLFYFCQLQVSIGTDFISLTSSDGDGDIPIPSAFKVPEKCNSHLQRKYLFNKKSSEDTKHKPGQDAQDRASFDVENDEDANDVDDNDEDKNGLVKNHQNSFKLNRHSHPKKIRSLPTQLNSTLAQNVPMSIKSDPLPIQNDTIPVQNNSMSNGAMMAPSFTNAMPTFNSVYLDYLKNYSNRTVPYSLVPFLIQSNDYSLGPKFYPNSSLLFSPAKHENLSEPTSSAVINDTLTKPIIEMMKNILDAQRNISSAIVQLGNSSSIQHPENNGNQNISKDSRTTSGPPETSSSSLNSQLPSSTAPSNDMQLSHGSLSNSFYPSSNLNYPLPLSLSNYPQSTLPRMSYTSPNVQNNILPFSDSYKPTVFKPILIEQPDMQNVQLQPLSVTPLSSDTSLSRSPFPSSLFRISSGDSRFFQPIVPNSFIPEYIRQLLSNSRGLLSSSFPQTDYGNLY